MIVVAYVAHVDDDVLLCGGTIARLTKSRHKVIIVYANNGINVHGRPGINLRGEAYKSAKVLGVAESDIYFLNVPTMEFEMYGQLELNKRFEKLKLEPDLIITHCEHDVNKDHKIVFESAFVQSRCYDCSISLICCEYIGNGSRFIPSLYVDVTSTIETKLRAMSEIECELKAFPHPRSNLGIKSRAMLRGSESGVKFAEAFEVKRWIVR